MLQNIQAKFNSKSKKVQVSMADLIVLGGAVGIEQAAAKAGKKIKVPFYPGRGDASDEQTDETSFAVLEPYGDGFRNYARDGLQEHGHEMIIDQAQRLNLSLPELTVLFGGLRSININYGGQAHGSFTKRKETLSNDYFVNLLDMKVAWQENKAESCYDGKSRADDKLLWKARKVDLIFGSNSEMRAVAEVYGADDSEARFYEDFVHAWVKVMTNDRYDLD